MLDILADMSAQGHAQAFLKDTASKGGTWVVDLPPAGGEALRAHLELALGPRKWKSFAVNHEGCLLVQGMTPFVREHRFYVVAHRVVASTASDRMLSALDGRSDRILDERVARLDVPAGATGYYDRGFSTHEVDRALVARMAWGARDLARALRDDDRGMDSYVIDMGETRDGRVLPIEVNGMPRAGHYGIPYFRVLRALRRRADRGRTGLLALGRRGRGDRMSALLDPLVAADVRARTARPDHDMLRRFVECAERRRGHEPGAPVPDAGRVAPGGDLRREWLTFVARQSRKDFERRAATVAEELGPGPIKLVKCMRPVGRTLADEAASPAWASGWDAWHRGIAAPRDEWWLVGLSVAPGDVDWAATLRRRPCPGCLDVVLAPGSRPILKAAYGPAVTTGEPMPPVARGETARDLDLSVLDMDELTGAVRVDTDYLAATMSDYVDRLCGVVGDPAQWEALRLEVSRTAARREDAWRRGIAGGVVRMLSTLGSDGMGRLTLAPVDGCEGAWRECGGKDSYGPDRVIAEVKDFDVRAMALASCRAGVSRMVEIRLVEGARTWPVPSRRPAEPGLALGEAPGNPGPDIDFDFDLDYDIVGDLGIHDALGFGIDYHPDGMPCRPDAIQGTARRGMLED